jgi:Ca-activated chloride channel family protein
MKLLLPSLLLASALCQAQGTRVPKPPWAGQSNSAPDKAPPVESTDDSAIKVEVKLVNVFVTVTDDRGSPVGNLNKDNFQLFEDGQPQKISIFSKESELPLSIVLDIDTSLSTRKDLPLEVNSARRFAHAIIRPVDALSVYGFNESVNQVIPFTSDLKTIDRGIEHLPMGAATALYDAVYLGAEALENRHGRNTGGEHALIQLSEDTGGKYYYATTIPQLDAAFRAISDELRTQYLLAYYPARRLADSDFRRIDVKLTGIDSSTDYKTRHRSGYYTSKLE